MKTIYLLLLIFPICCFQCKENAGIPNLHKKIKGLTFDGPPNPPITSKMLESMKQVNANWVSTTPEAHTYHHNLEVKSYLQEGQWYGESFMGSLAVIKIAKEQGMKVMLKPHIGFINDLSNWTEPPNLDMQKQTDRETHFKSQMAFIKTQKKVTKGTWRGDFEPKNEADWPIWEKGYRKFILNCAQIADSTQVDLFCIGTELSRSAVKREQFWRELIIEVKKIYKGPITYSANWDNFQKIKFWDQLDYIGTNAYFPLTDSKDPSEKLLLKEWNTPYNQIKALSNQYKKPIIFTEFGYVSSDNAAKEPWNEHKREAGENEILQAKLYNALFTKFWKESWFAGSFVWKWYYAGNGGEKSYSPQFKKAEATLQKWYKSPD